MMRQSFALLVSISVVSAAICASVSAQTLEEALADAYMNNPTLEAERARQRATDENVPQALSGWRPNVRSFASIGKRHIKSDESSIIGEEDSTLTPHTYGVELEQPLFRGGQTLAQTRSAENTVRAGREALWSTEQRVLFSAATAFADVYRAQAVLDLTIRNEQRLVRELEATRDRFQVGEVTRTDVFQAEARLARATAERIRAEGDLDVARAAYRNVIGKPPGTLRRPGLPEGLPGSEDEAITEALKRNPDVRRREFEERSAADSVDSVRGRLLPSLSLVGRADEDYEQARNNARFNTYEGLLQLTVPIYQQGTVYSQLRQAKQVVTQQRRILDEAQRQTVKDATDAWTSLETARAAIVSRKKQVEANRVALDGVQREAEVGARTILDILNAQQELLDSQVQLVGAERDEVVAAYALQRSVGDLTAPRLRLPVAVYDPRAHYNQVRGAWIGGSSSGDSSQDFDRRLHDSRGR
jgi:outer membrane protein